LYYEGIKRGDEEYKLFTTRPYHLYKISSMLELWDVLSQNLSNSQINFIEEMGSINFCVELKIKGKSHCER